MRSFAPLCLLACVSLASAAFAQDTTERLTRIIVPVGPGTASDLIARTLADEIHSVTGRTVIVDNKVGAGGGIAVAALKQSPPDGETLLLAALAVPVLLPLAAGKTDYDSTKDFAPVTQVGEYAVAYAVGPRNPATSLTEFITWARAHPADASFASPGAGGLGHLFGVMIGQISGVELIHVPYKSSTQLAAELMGGQVASAMGTVWDFIALHRAGRIRIIGTSGGRRSTLTPEIPTFKEQGFPAVVGVGWLGLFAPANTPKAVVDRWSKLLRAALQKPAIHDKLIGLGVEPTGTTPETLAAIIVTDTARWKPIVKASGITVE